MNSNDKALANNPLLDFSGLPRFDAIKTEHVEPARQGRGPVDLGADNSGSEHRGRVGPRCRQPLARLGRPRSRCRALGDDLNRLVIGAVEHAGHTRCRGCHADGRLPRGGGWGGAAAGRGVLGRRPDCAKRRARDGTHPDGSSNEADGFPAR